MSVSAEYLPTAAFAHAVAVIVGQQRSLATWQRVQGGGYTPAARLRVRFATGESVFVKAATSENTAQWLRTERRVYESLSPGKYDFLPRYYGAGEADGFPFLVLEDLTSAHWPPPWSEPLIHRLLSTFEQVRAAASSAPADLPLCRDAAGAMSSWHDVAANPDAFLHLGFCSASWLDTALPTLAAASDAAPFDGSDLLHMDIRSDNLCFCPDGRTVIVDWNHACIGNGALEIAGWLPSLCDEGGPLPETLMPTGGAEFAAWLSGYWGYQAGKPSIPTAPHVRTIQRRQLAVALPWAVRALGLPPLDGVS